MKDSFSSDEVEAARASLPAPINPPTEPEHWEQLRALGWVQHHCKVCGESWGAISAPAPLPDEWKRLYAAVNQLMAHMGMHGSADARGDRAQAVMDALHAIDGGHGADTDRPISNEKESDTSLLKESMEALEGVANVFREGRAIVNMPSSIGYVASVVNAAEDTLAKLRERLKEA